MVVTTTTVEVCSHQSQGFPGHGMAANSAVGGPEMAQSSAVTSIRRVSVELRLPSSQQLIVS